MTHLSDEDKVRAIYQWCDHRPAQTDEVEILKAEMFTLTKAVHSLVVTATEPEDGQVRVDAAEYDRLAEVLDALHGG